MKYLLLASILVIGVVGCKNDNQHKPKHRYFFVGYSCSNLYTTTDGNLFYKLDTLPTMAKLKQDIYEMYYCSDHYKKENIIILSVHEFKDSAECFKFKGSPESPITFCDTTKPILRVGLTPFNHANSADSIKISDREVNIDYAEEVNIGSK